MTCDQKENLDALLKLKDKGVLTEDEFYFVGYLDLHWRKHRLSDGYAHRLARIAERLLHRAEANV